MIGEVIGGLMGELIATVFVEIIWRNLLNFVGGTIRWVYGTTWRTIARKPKYKFKEYINGLENSYDWFDNKRHNFVNSVIGLLTIVLIIINLIYFL